MFAHYDAREARIRQLQRDGYVELVQNRWLLTDLGWRTLSAAADPKPPPVTQSKTEMMCELRKWERGLLLTAWPISNAN